MRIFIIASAMLLAVTGAQAQVGSGSNNGNNNSGVANGNGNGNGSGNTLSATSNSRHIALAAPSLAAAGIESCLGSTSVGGAGGGVGVTIASTVTDRGCNLRLFSRTLYNLGHRHAATQILCNDPDAALALRSEGVHCEIGVGAEMERAAAVRAMAAMPAPVETTSAADPRLAAGTKAPCMNYTLFRGCLDAPPPVMAETAPAPQRPRAHSARSANKRAAKPQTPNG